MPDRAEAIMRPGDGETLRLRGSGVPGLTEELRVQQRRRLGERWVEVCEDETGVRLGWRDERTGQVHVEDGADLARVHAALTRWDRARPSPTD